EYLSPKSNQNFADCTVGSGGHTKAILERNGPKGKVLGIDQDSEYLESIDNTLVINNMLSALFKNILKRLYRSCYVTLLPPTLLKTRYQQPIHSGP
ncbi:MAG: 16S rRNA (cytosine(1402)-N(4))-methyltransferase, partial [Bacteroidetes bacterium]|nr:16S rRNA (cytosine(1402)-N(4))-methyltransferase [Bacteroidota bacterium]